MYPNGEADGQLVNIPVLALLRWEVGFTLLSWELREKDYSREAKRGCLWASERRRVLGSVVTKTKQVFVKPTISISVRL